MRRTLKFLAVASAMVMPAAAHAQACTGAQLAANPLVALGYRAFVRIDNNAFDLSCFYQNIGGGLISLSTSSVTVGAGTTELKAIVNQATFDFSDPSQPLFNYGVASNQNMNATTPADFVFAFASPLTSNYYVEADAQIGVTRASGNPDVSIIPGGAPSTVALGGYPAYLVGQSTFLQVSGGGSVINPNAVGLGVGVGSAACNSGTACSYPSATSNPNVGLSAWLTVISYRQDHAVPTTRVTNAQVNGQVGLIASAVPEPATVTLMATGLLSLVGMGYARRRNNA